MKRDRIIAAWPDYARNRIVAVTKDGRVLQKLLVDKPIIGPDDALVAAQDRAVIRYRAALIALGKTADDCDRIARDAE